MRLKGLILISILLLGGVSTKAQELSANAKISVLTVSPGHEEWFAAFGHSAIHITDSASGLDKVYNFGTYYFNQPYFYLNVARGYMLYGLSVTSYKRFQAYYVYFNRQVSAQYLNLSQHQIQQVFDFLENNAKSENSMYYYDYFYDNCATRIRDVFIQVLGKEIKFSETFVDNPGETIRHLTDYYIEDEFPWGKLSIDLCLGLPMDKVLTDYEYMYLPDYLQKGFNTTQIKKDSIWVNSVASEKIILASRPMNYPAPWLTPTIAFSMLLFIGIAFFIIQLKKGWLFRWFDFMLFFFIGSIGLLLFLLWFATDHYAAANNFNLLWAIPTHLVVAFGLLRKQTKHWVNWYIAFLVPLSLFLIIFWKIIPQDLNEGFIPIVFLILVRSIAILKK